MKKMKDWTFITNHGLVLIYIAQHPQCTTREMASTVNATERTVHRVLIELEKDGYITRQRTGKGNIYQINIGQSLKHELARDVLVGDLLAFLNVKRERKSKTR